jgi:diguanylate cyclase (GGDEF)-like protein/PAS domain S-box-containing protein
MTILADSFNNMANEIESNITALQEQARLLEEQKGEIEDLNESLEEKIAIKTAKIKEYIEVLDEYIITSTTDLDGVITDVSSAFCKISGYKKEELIGKNHNIVRHPDNPPELFENLWETIQSGQKWEGDIKNIRKDGSLYWVDVKIAPNFGSDGKLKSFTAIRTDITDKKIIEELSITDTLTKLYNRRHFNEVILKEIARNKRDDNYFSFLMMDIDHFKLYNDTYGHQAGDNVLSLIAKYLIDSLSRASDYAFRLGGEEFAIIFSGLNPKDAFEFADKIRFGIENLQIEHKKNSASSYVTTSMGLVTLKGNDIADEINLYNMADETLYLAKSQGRNRVVEK